MRQYNIGASSREISVEITGIFQANNGNKYGLLFSKRPEVYPIRNQDVEFLIVKFGVPLQIHSDEESLELPF